METFTSIEISGKLKSYGELRSAVQKTFMAGQRKMEELKVQIYWRTGKIIRRYLELHPDEQPYNVLERLSEDFNVERTLFYRVLQFADAYPRVAPGRLSWTHHRELLAIPDGNKRADLIREAESQAWPVRKLRREIFKRKTLPRSGEINRFKTGEILEEPRRGKPGVYQIGWLAGLDGKKRKVIDLGFDIYRELSAAEEKRFEKGASVVWSESRKTWIAGGSADDFYFYQAEVERVVDGDTLLVHVDMGFQMKRRQYIRFRGIDAEARSEIKGQKARQFLAGILKNNPRIEFKSRFTDKYDRYLSDVWAGSLYLNQELLTRGLAIKV
jgi:endonuclease YncB( thermonuclease family)